MGVDLNPLRVGSLAEHVIPAQNSFVFAAATTSGTRHIFAADLWTSSADGLKSHDRQFWAPLEFDDAASPPTIAPLVWLDAFELDLA